MAHRFIYTPRLLGAVAGRVEGLGTGRLRVAGCM